MHFDTLCKISELIGSQQIMNWVKNAKVFHLPDSDKALIQLNQGKTYTPEQAVELHRDFHMPFQYTAVEGDCAAVIYADPDVNTIGGAAERDYVMALNMGETVTVAQLPPRLKGKYFSKSDPRDNNLYAIMWGSFNIGRCLLNYNNTLAYDLDGVMAGLSIFNPRTSEMTFPIREFVDADGAEMKRRLMREATVLVTLFATMNSHDRFIVEATPKHHAKMKDSARPLRVQDRPTYTILDLAAIQAKYIRNAGVGESTGGHKAAHPRRAHLRYYSDDRYVNKKGTWQRISEVWVGPKEATVGNKHYKVLTHL